MNGKQWLLHRFLKKKISYDKKFLEVYKLNNNGFELNLSYFDFYLFDRKPNFYNKKLEELFGKPRNKNEKITKRHHEIAGALTKNI